MEKDNMLRVERISMLNPALPEGSRFWKRDVADAFRLTVPPKRMAGFNRLEYRRMTNQERADALKYLGGNVKARMKALVQRRHEIVHNCDRPKSRPVPLKSSEVERALQDIQRFVRFVDDHLDLHRIA